MRWTDSYQQMMRERAEDAKRRELERAREENRKRSQEQRAVIEVRREGNDCAAAYRRGR